MTGSGTAGWVSWGSWALAACGWLLAVAGAIGVRRRAGRRAVRNARAAHELRGPLWALGLGLELAARTGSLPGSRARALEGELARARRALDDLFGLGDPEQVELVATGPLLADSVEAWRPAAAARGLELELSAGATRGPAWVRGDRVRLAQAVGNLIANAIEHGAAAIAVSSSCSGAAVRIEVLDGGRGLPAPLAELLRGSRRRPLGHLSAWPPAGQARGHGLRIVADIARAHGGSLSAGPSERGARLVLELPQAAAPPDASGLRGGTGR